MLRCGVGVRRCVVVLCLRHSDFEYDRREGFRDRTACNRSSSGAYVGGWVGGVQIRSVHVCWYVVERIILELR